MHVDEHEKAEQHGKKSDPGAQHDADNCEELPKLRRATCRPTSCIETRVRLTGGGARGAHDIAVRVKQVGARRAAPRAGRGIGWSRAERCHRLIIQLPGSPTRYVEPPIAGTAMGALESGAHGNRRRTTIESSYASPLRFAISAPPSSTVTASGPRSQALRSGQPQSDASTRLFSTRRRRARARPAASPHSRTGQRTTTPSTTRLVPGISLSDASRSWTTHLYQLPGGTLATETAISASPLEPAGTG